MHFGVSINIKQKPQKLRAQILNYILMSLVEMRAQKCGNAKGMEHI